ELQNGDRVEILTSQNSKGPSMDWLKIVKSSQARNKINAWYKQQNKDVNLARGKELIQAYLKAKSLNATDVLKPQYIEACLRKYRYPDWDSVLAAIGRGGLKEGQIINRLLEEMKREQEIHVTDEELIRNIEENSQKAKKTDKNSKGIVVQGLHDLSVHFSHCCSPVPGDEIIGYVTRGRGISIHRTDCPNIMSLPDSEKARMISAEWAPDAEKESKNRYETHIVVYCENRRGMFADISRVMTDNEIDIMSVFSRVNKQGMGMIHLSFEITSADEITKISSKLRQIPGVIDIQRSAG
ncbi:MAG: bifunctional (p)ppGpp synthetase/guanosine-3',5'-bis(diphosphate) 3'-pyrophosphohydrolase, partial [Lachnospiraceae bacterium]|nr:bifunctional (p)ppGpp synthetase/guanosine-3',5'-bis(diphosphate) 3'-pyrophosphohydrolase [Lachnospiraceae bacterium]